MLVPVHTHTPSLLDCAPFGEGLGLSPSQLVLMLLHSIQRSPAPGREPQHCHMGWGTGPFGARHKVEELCPTLATERTEESPASDVALVEEEEEESGGWAGAEGASTIRPGTPRR